MQIPGEYKETISNFHSFKFNIIIYIQHYSVKEFTENFSAQINVLIACFIIA